MSFSDWKSWWEAAGGYYLESDKMKHIVRKAFIDYEKEEKWLNEMAAKGLAMTDYSWCRYAFEETPPGEYTYRLELLDNLAVHPESRKYIQFLEETGVDQVASYGRWVYFRKKTADGPFELYSDIDSKIKHYQRVFQLWFVLGIAELLIGFSNTMTGLTQWMEGGTNLNGWLGLPLLFIGLVFMFSLALPLHRKIKRLKAEKELME
jgi:hypothetical protein